MDHVDWLDEQAASQLASRLADQVPTGLNHLTHFEAIPKAMRMCPSYVFAMQLKTS